MMSPNQINAQTFSQVGKGGYKAVEVDAFLQRVYQNYNKLFTDNKTLIEKLDETLPLLDEYNQRKNSIADALIWAKSTAEKNIEEAQMIADNLVADATVKAEKLLEEKKAEADAYYASKTTEAEKRAEKANAEYENLKNKSEVYAEKYIAEVEVKAKALIEQANIKSASIVADAYADVKKAKDKADFVLSEANKELNALKAEAAKIKNELLKLITNAQMAAEAVENRIFDPIEADETADDEQIAAPVLDENDIESFNLDAVEFEEIEEIEEIVEEEAPVQSDFVRLFGTETPGVNELLTGIFTAVNEQNARKTQDDDNSFRFSGIFADPAVRDDTRIFNPMKDSE